MNKARSRESIVDLLTRWFAYGVILSLLPLGAHFMIVYLHAPRAPSVRSILVSTIADGELLLVGCCIGAGALGERIGRLAVWPGVESISGVFCMLAVILSGSAYGATAAGIVRRQSSLPKVSGILFGVTVLCSAILMAATFRSRTSGCE